jgi:tetratricopeptide (TPR) repeat protein
MRDGLEHAYGAMHAYREIGEHRAEGSNLQLIGLFHSLMGELDTGIDYLEQSLKIATEAGNDPIRLILLTHLAEIQIHRGRLDLATAHLEEAVELERNSVSIDRTSDIPGVRARLLLAAGRSAEALEFARQVAAERTGDADHRIRACAMVTQAAALDAAGEREDAVALYDRVLAMTEHDATVFHRVEGVVGRAAAMLHSGDVAGARDAAVRALRLARQAEYRFLEGRALNVLAEIDLRAGQLAKAAGRATEAMEIHRQTGHRAGETASLQLLADCTTDPETARTGRNQARALSPQEPPP